MPFNHHPAVEQGLRAEEALQSAAGIFPPICGHGGPGKPRLKPTGMEYEETEKKWELREKSQAASTFFFRQIVLYYLMVFCRNPSYAAVCRAEHRTLTG